MPKTDSKWGRTPIPKRSSPKDQLRREAEMIRELHAQLKRDFLRREKTRMDRKRASPRKP